MKDFKTISIVGFFTACACLYHVTYWAKFNINGLEYIGVSDIVKTFVYPVLLFAIIVVVPYFIGSFVADLFPIRQKKSEQIKDQIQTPSNLLKITYLFLFILWFSLVQFLYSWANEEYWILWVSVTCIFPIIYLIHNDFLKNVLSNSNDRFYAIAICVLLPLISIAAGKYRSDLVFNNSTYTYIIKNDSILVDSIFIKKNDTLKLLGKTENYMFFSTLDNKEVLLINLESTVSLVFFNYDKKIKKPTN